MLKRVGGKIGGIPTLGVFLHWGYSYIGGIPTLGVFLHWGYSYIGGIPTLPYSMFLIYPYLLTSSDDLQNFTVAYIRNKGVTAHQEL